MPVRYSRSYSNPKSHTRGHRDLPYRWACRSRGRATAVARRAGPGSASRVRVDPRLLGLARRTPRVDGRALDARAPRIPLATPPLGAARRALVPAGGGLGFGSRRARAARARQPAAGALGAVARRPRGLAQPRDVDRGAQEEAPQLLDHTDIGRGAAQLPIFLGEPAAADGDIRLVEDAAGTTTLGHARQVGRGECGEIVARQH